MKRNAQKGFTLLEIMIAVVILSIALVTLLSLQASVLSQEVRDRDRQAALGIARQILAAIETRDDPLDDGEQTLAAGELLKNLSEGNQKGGSSEPIKGGDFTAILTVSPRGIPTLSENDLQEIHLTIRWGNSDLDKVSFTYMKTDERAVT